MAEVSDSAAKPVEETAEETPVAAPETAKKTEPKEEAAPAEAEAEAEEEPDLTKPLPVVPKPDNDAYARKNAEMDEQIGELRKRREALQKEISDINNAANSTNTEFGRERAVMQSLRQEKDKLVRERKEIYDARDAAKDVLERSQSAMRSLRAELKFTSVEDIENEIAKLRYKQETESMALSDEKALVKEIEALQASKKVVAQFAEQNAAVRSNRESTATYREQIAAKNAEIDGVTERIKAQREVMNKLNEQNTPRQRIPELIEKRNGINKEMDACYAEKKALYNAHSEAWAKHKKYLTNRRKQIKIEREAQRVRDAEEEEKRRAEWIEEQKKKEPFEEEQALCDFLVKYLSGLLTPAEDSSAAAAAEESSAAADANLEIGGGKVLKERSGYDDDLHFLVAPKKKSKKKRNRKAATLAPTDALRHTMDTLGDFGHLGLTAPTTLAAVPAAIESIKEKKAWYKTQPRQIAEYPGDRRRNRDRDAADENGAAQANGDQATKKGGKKKAQAPNFELEDADLFPTLPGGPAVAAAADAAPVEDAEATAEEA